MGMSEFVVHLCRKNDKSKYIKKCKHQNKITWFVSVLFNMYYKNTQQ